MTLLQPANLLGEYRVTGRGIGAFNVLHLESAEAIAAAAERAGLPVIMQISQNCAKFHGGLAPLARATIAIAESASVPVAVHLDHAEDPALVTEAIGLGFTSVMYDGSKLPTAENRAETARVTREAHAAGVYVEAELGEIGGKAGAHTPGVRTDPDEAKQFVAETGVDALAVAVGSEHAMKERTASLDLGLIGRLKNAIDVPLVLHGSSGVPDEEIARAIGAGMVKINVSTHLAGEFTRAIREWLDENPDALDSRKYIGAGRDALAAEAARLLTLFAGGPRA